MVQRAITLKSERQNNSIRLFRIISILSKVFFRLPDHMCHDIDGMLGAGLPASMNTTKTQIHMWHFNVPKLKKVLTFSVNDRY